MHRSEANKKNVDECRCIQLQNVCTLNADILGNIYNNLNFSGLTTVRSSLLLAPELQASSKVNQFIYGLKYTKNESLVKFIHWLVRYCAKKLFRTPAPKHREMQKCTHGQITHKNASSTPVSGAGTKICITELK